MASCRAPAPATVSAPAPAPSPSPASPTVARPLGVLSTDAPAGSSTPLADADTTEIMIVVSKLKKYIRERSGMNTSDGIVDALSDHVRALADLCIRNAAAAGRKTVLDRDVPKVSR